MCFKNLPIEFDAQGKPFLRTGVANPYAPTTTAPRGVPTQLTADKVEELLRRNGYIKDLDFDPVTRVAGALAFHTVADFNARKVIEARSVATLFRGYEVIMVGRDPRDAIFITSRACGVCGGVHSVTSAMAIEMAIGCVPPPLGDPDSQPRPGARVPLRPSPAPPPAGRPRLFVRYGGAHQPIAPGAGAIERGAARRDPRLPDDGRADGRPESAERKAVPGGAAHDAGGAGSLRADLWQVSAPADHRARRHELHHHARA